jgi:glycosyl transferase family 25
MPDTGSAGITYAGISATSTSLPTRSLAPHVYTEPGPDRDICASWNCSCQGFSDVFHTLHMRWGKAKLAHPKVRKWWIAHQCRTTPYDIQNKVKRTSRSTEDMFELVEKVVYINMDERTDRRTEIMRELQLAFPVSKIQRLRALRHEGMSPVVNGAIGCTKSHIAALEMAQTEAWANVLIVEDDLMWVNFENGATRMNELMRAPYDVIVLGGTAVLYDVNTGRVSRSKTTTGYIVAAHYYDKLLANYKDGLAHLLKSGLRTKYAIDAHWSSLQRTDAWYIVQPHFVMQRSGFSNIQGRNINYASLFS